MIRPIVTSQIMLRMPSEPVVPGDPVDVAVGQDLLDTLAAHTDGCVGLAANMIGARKRIIAVMDGTRPLLMFNPKIVERVDAYETEEGCLSLSGVRSTTRYRRIRLEYLDADFRPRTQTFTGYTAQIIQHEIDHCDGIVI